MENQTKIGKKELKILSQLNFSWICMAEKRDTVLSINLLPYHYHSTYIYEHIDIYSGFIIISNTNALTNW